RFRSEESDFLGLLAIWKLWQESRSRSQRQLIKLCREHFLSYKRMREWEDVHDQLVRVMREMGFVPGAQPASAEQIHRALLPGLLSRIGMWNREARVFVGARQTRFAIHPSSGLARKSPPWVMAAELVETSQLFARSVAAIDPTWLEAAAGPLCARHHGEPHPEQRPAPVMAEEHHTLDGLPDGRRPRVPHAQLRPAPCP